MHFAVYNKPLSKYLALLHDLQPFSRYRKTLVGFEMHMDTVIMSSFLELVKCVWVDNYCIIGNKIHDARHQLTTFSMNSYVSVVQWL